MTYEDRLALAQTAAVMTYQRRGDFISNDDCLDIAERFTTDTLDFEDPNNDHTDYHRLANDLTTWVFQPEEN